METKLLLLFHILADIFSVFFLFFFLGVGGLFMESLAADAAGPVVLSRLDQGFKVCVCVPSLIRLHTGSALFVLPLVLNLAKVRKTALISAPCGAGPVEMLGGDKGQEVAECL